MTNEISKKEIPNPLEAAQVYVRRSWTIIPVPFQSKSPALKGWQNLDLTEPELPKFFNGKQQNIGVILGKKSGNLVDVDLDSPEAIKLADWFLPKTYAIFGRNSKPRSHRLYYCADAEYRKFNNPVLMASTDADERRSACIVEIRTSSGGKGFQTIFPPSVHPLGEPIEWQSDSEPLAISFDDLKSAVTKLASASLLAKYWRNGIRHELALVVSGALLRHGFTVDEAKHFVKAICVAVNDDEISDRIQAVEDTAKAISKGENAFGFPKLAELTDKKIVKSISEWLGIEFKNQPTDAGNFNSQPNPLDMTLKPVEPIDDSWLPNILVNWLKPASRVIGCPYDFLVLSAIVTAGSLIGARVRVKPLENSDWFIVPNLYGGLVGLPSTKKTPALDETQKPILELQSKARGAFKQKMRDYEIELRFFEKEEKGIFNKAKTADEAKTTLAELQKPEKPVLSRFQTNDVTTSKLIHFLAENPNGLLLFRDELIGWLRSMENDYEKSARAFILEVWKGAISYELARVDGREIPLTSGTLSIIGGIQPSKLQKYVGEAYSFDNSDGFLQRLTFVYPDLISNRTKPTGNDFEQKQLGFEQANRIFQKLAERDFEGKCVSPNGDKFFAVKFQKYAQKIVDRWRDEIESEAEKIQARDEAFAAYLYKLPKTCFGIALIFHCIDNIGNELFPDEMTEETAAQAISYTDYLISHTKRVFALGENQIFDLARKLVGRIKNGELPQGFTQREIMRKKWSGFRSVDDLNDVLSLLVDYSYLRAIKTTEGRPTTKFFYHPTLECKTGNKNEADS